MPADLQELNLEIKPISDETETEKIELKELSKAEVPQKVAHKPEGVPDELAEELGLDDLMMDLDEPEPRPEAKE